MDWARLVWRVASDTWWPSGGHQVRPIRPQRDSRGAVAARGGAGTRRVESFITSALLEFELKPASASYLGCH